MTKGACPVPSAPASCLMVRTKRLSWSSRAPSPSTQAMTATWWPLSRYPIASSAEDTSSTGFRSSSRTRAWRLLARLASHESRSSS